MEQRQKWNARFWVNFGRHTASHSAAGRVRGRRRVQSPVETQDERILGPWIAPWSSCEQIALALISVTNRSKPVLSPGHYAFGAKVLTVVSSPLCWVPVTSSGLSSGTLTLFTHCNSQILMVSKVLPHRSEMLAFSIMRSYIDGIRVRSTMRGHSLLSLVPWFSFQASVGLCKDRKHNCKKYSVSDNCCISDILARLILLLVVFGSFYVPLCFFVCVPSSFYWERPILLGYFSCGSFLRPGLKCVSLETICSCQLSGSAVNLDHFKYKYQNEPFQVTQVTFDSDANRDWSLVSGNNF